MVATKAHCVVTWGDVLNPLDSAAQNSPRCLLRRPWFQTVVW